MKSHGYRRVTLSLITAAIFGLLVCGQAVAGATERVSVSSSGEQGGGSGLKQTYNRNTFVVQRTICCAINR